MPFKFSKFEVAAHPMAITARALQHYLLPLTRQSEFWQEPPALVQLAKKEAMLLSGVTGVPLTVNYSDPQQEDSIAFYLAQGPLMYDDYPWYFNTKTFVQNFQAAEANPAVSAHFLSINSGGGLAYYLDYVHQTLSHRDKPLVVHCEQTMCSAAIYLASPANKINCTTPFDRVGSIGTMTSFWDIKPYFEKEGFVYHEHYATQSSEKNKRFNDLLAGKPDDFIEHELTPLAAQFISDVKQSRPKAQGDGLYAGQTYSAQEALEMKLIDGINPIEESLLQAQRLGAKYQAKQRIHNTFNKYIE